MAREMKDSGIEWIGVIPKDRKIIRNKYYLDYVKGKNPSELNSDKIGVPYIGASDLDKERNYDEYSNYRRQIDIPMCDIGDVLVLWDGARAGLIGRNHTGAISSTIVSINPTVDVINKHFWYWYLKGMEKYLYDCVSGTTIPHMNRKFIDDINMIDWTTDEQERIADYLDGKCKEIDKVIENTKATIEEYKKYKQSVITEAVTKGLNPDVEIMESGINWNKHIPVHWEVVNGRRLFALRKDKALPNDKQLTASQKYGIIYQDEFMELENQRVVTVEKDFDILKHVEPNDFVISMRSFQGGLEYSQLSGCISSAYVMLIPNEKVYCPYFRWLFKCVKYINALQSTSNLVRDGQAMRYSNFVQVPLFIIPIEEQKEIAEYLDVKCTEIDNLISKKQQIISELESYKKSLIYECVTGKVEVK